MKKTVKEKKSVHIVTQYFYPEEIGSAPYITEISKWFAHNNYITTVLTNRPYYPYNEVYELYIGGNKDHEIIDGVILDRVKPSIPKKNNIVFRAIADFNFILKALFKNGFKKHERVVTLCPSVLSVAAGNILKAKGGRHVAIVHDIQSGLADSLNLSLGLGLIIKILKYMEMKILNSTNQVVVLTQGMSDSLENIGVSSAKIIKIPIWVDTELISPERHKNVTIDENLLMYSGNLGKKQGLNQLIELAEILQKDPETSHLKMMIRGEGNQKEDLVKRVKQLNLQNVNFEGLVPKSRLSRELSKPVLHLVPQDPDSSEFAMPSKTYTLMSLQKTFVATANKGSSLHKFENETNAFITVPPNEPNVMKDRIIKLLKDSKLRSELEKNGRAYIKAHHSKETILNKYLLLF